MQYLRLSKIISERVTDKTMDLFNEFYTEAQFNLIKDTFCTYHHRNGALSFADFAMIPINKDPGDMSNERGFWTKFIRDKLAHEWDDIIKRL